MGYKTCAYILHKMRQSQLCNSLASINCSRFTRNYRLEATIPLLLDACVLRLACGSATVPIRRVSYETSSCREAKNMNSKLSDRPCGDSSVISDDDHETSLYCHTGLKPDELASSHNMLPASIMIELNKCTTLMEVLNVFSTPTYKKDELFEGVTKLWTIFLKLDEKQRLTGRNLIVRHPHFKNLIQGVWKVAPAMQPGALVRILYVFVHLKISQRSLFIQNLLLICQEQLSSLNEVEIAILANTLERLKSDKNVDLLKFGLRLLVAVKIEEFNEVTPLLTMIKSIGRSAPLSLKSKLGNKALQMVDRFTLENCERLFSSLAAIHFYAERLLDACSNKLINDIDQLPFTKIASLLSCCCELNYGNIHLLTAVGDHIVKNFSLWKPLELALILQYFVHIRFRHVPLLDRYADFFLSNLNSITIWDLSKVIKVYSLLNYLPEKSEQFLEAVKTSLQEHLNNIPPKQLADIVFNLCILGVNPDCAMNKLLQYENILNLKENGLLMHIKLSLKSLSNNHSCPPLRGVPSVSSEDIQTFHTAVKNLFEDPDLYQHSIQIAYTHYIDFIFALDTRGNKLVPVDIRNGVLYILDNSENIVRVAVLCCTPNAFALGTVHPLGKLALKIRNIESCGFSVVVVPLHKFLRITEEEREEFLRTIIFQGLPDSQDVLKDRRAEEDLEKNFHDT